MRADAAVTPSGSLLILDIDSRAQAQALIVADPATRAGLRPAESLKYN